MTRRTRGGTLWRACMFLVVLAGAGAALGSAILPEESTGVPEAQAPAERTLIIPPARAGDRGEYSLTLRDETPAGSLDVETSIESRSYEWTEARVAPDASGKLRTVHDLKLIRQLGQEREATLLSVAPTTGTVISTTTTSSNGVAVVWYEKALEGPLDPSPCAPLLGLHKQPVYLSRPTVLFRDCVLEFGARTLQVGPEGMDFVAVRESTYLGDPVFEFANAATPDLGPEAVRAWISPRFPVPLRITYARPDSSLVDVVDLVRFDAGLKPLARADPVRSLPPLESGPRQPWGMDETGVDHGFPLSQAYDDARADADSRFGRFARDHPDAVPIYAALTSSDDRSLNARTEEWTFWAVAGDECVGFYASRVTRSAPDGLDVDLPPSESSGDATCYEEERWPGPSQFPTLRSLLDRVNAYLDVIGLDLEPQAWGYTPNCDTLNEGPCGGRKFAFSAGSTHSVYGPSLEKGAQAPGTDYWSVGVRPGGTLAYFVQWSDSPLALLDPTSAVVPLEAEPRPLGAHASTGGPDALAAAPWNGSAIGLVVAASVAGILTLVAVSSAVREFLFAPFMTRADPLGHPVRKALLDRIRAEPGVETYRLARMLAVARPTLRYHLAVLQRGRLVVVHRVQGRTAIFPRGRRLPPAEPVSILRRDAARRLFDRVSARPGLDQATLAAEVGFSQQRVSLILRRLVAAGIVFFTVDSGRRRYHAAEPFRFMQSSSPTFAPQQSS